jgi:hypothetical protein
VCWKPCSSCWSSHHLREEFLSTPIHSPSLVRRIGPSEPRQNPVQPHLVHHSVCFLNFLNFCNLLSVTNLNKDALLKFPNNLKDKVSHVYALRNIYCFWDDQNEVRIMRSIFLLSCLWRVLYIISKVSLLRSIIYPSRAFIENKFD